MATHREVMAFVATCLLFLIATVSCKRTVTTQLNYMCDVPECKTGVNGSFANLVYVRAQEESDVLHYAISTIHIPTILVIHTRGDANSKLNVDWEKLMVEDEFTNDSISVSDPNTVVYSYAVVFTKLHEYNDTADAADLNAYPAWNSTERVVRDFDNFEWMEASAVKGEKNAFVFNSTVLVNSTNDMFGHDAPQNYTPSLSFTFRVFDEQSRESSLPHLLYNENVTQFDFTLDNFMPSFSMSRFAVELAIISQSKKEDMSIEETKSIDDEYTPGVFRITNLKARPKDQANGAFVQWKPVCYQDTPRSRSVATSVQKYALGDIKNVTSLLKSSLAYAYFSDDLFSMNSATTNVSFGLSKDGSYTKTNYTSWTASVGNGNPPTDKVSLLVIGVISAGLGIPVIIIVFGGIFVCIKKQRKKNYRHLQDVSSSYPQNGVPT
ncbi:glycosylated lysosomal membrane protein-like [Haliotis rufescens]|uniref:glycosylated lysosomal membrane protein-like n=1 Tax=Haliotis rufescens TaxID=6454 RepID=UPI001EAFB75C|nr:glycosylated lysosomal membrane protein-like [Haliotis rufescens]